MSEPIKTGDLVVMVRGYKPDCQCEPVGVPFKVSRIRGSYEPLRCHCAEQLPACQVAEGFDSYRVVPLQWLKTLPCHHCLAPAPSDPSHPNFFKSQRNKAPDPLAIPECRDDHECYERNGFPDEEHRLARAALFMLQAIFEGRLKWVG